MRHLVLSISNSVIPKRIIRDRKWLNMVNVTRDRCAVKLNGGWRHTVYLCIAILDILNVSSITQWLRNLFTAKSA